MVLEFENNDGSSQDDDRKEKVLAVFNGEIYNWKELDATLDRENSNSESVSDGEVILPLYKKYGPHFVRRLRGEYAIVVGDRQVKEEGATAPASAALLPSGGGCFLHKRRRFSAGCVPGGSVSYAASQPELL